MGSPSWVSRWLAALILLTIIVLVNINYLNKTSKPSAVGTHTRSAFLRWRSQILDPEHGLSAGGNIYERFTYPNPPIQALILKPFMEFSPTTGALVWLNLKVLLAAVAFLWSLRLVRSDTPPAEGPIALAFVFAAHPIISDLTHGNVNIFIAFLLAGMVEAYRRGWDYLAGITLALAIACKVTPALFFSYFGWKWLWGIYQQWNHSLRSALWGPSFRVLLGTVAGLGLWWFLVPGAILGFDYNNHLLRSWYEVMVKPFVVDGKVTSEEASQSIPGVVFRLLTHEPSSQKFDENGVEIESEREYVNLLSVDRSTAQMLIRGCQILFVGILIFTCRLPSAGESTVRSGRTLAAEFSLILLGMLLFSERTWKHHGTVLMLPYLVIACHAAATGRRWFQFPYSLFAGIGLLILVPSILGGKAQDLALTYGSHLFIFLLLELAIVSVLYSTPARRGKPR